MRVSSGDCLLASPAPSRGWAQPGLNSPRSGQPHSGTSSQKTQQVCPRLSGERAWCPARSRAAASPHTPEAPPWPAAPQPLPPSPGRPDPSHLLLRFRGHQVLGPRTPRAGQSLCWLPPGVLSGWPSPSQRECSLLCRFLALRNTSILALNKHFLL